ncbi:MAG: pantoate--beta-alanine ligase [Dehalococcoidia bacterium]|nr:pantoate--beta-alanine ligase [Dehalococcoidia bacterium]
MQTLHTIPDFRRAHAALAGSLGLVPTMGYLHEGHLTLVRRAKEENDHVAVSIFVNPTQFGPAEDLAAYPRDLDRDLALLRKAGVDLVFNPSPAEMYPPGQESMIDTGSVSQPLEGQRRPGHFRGVATVVAKLFNIAQAQRAYFGAKDAQQVRVIQRMARDLDVPTAIIVVPTVREPDGLAMSSRNVYLTPPERIAARCLSRGLRLAEAGYAGGERSADALREVVRQTIAAEPLVTVDYISLADSETLAELEGPLTRAALLSLAVRIGKARLIDNVTLGE